MYFLVENLALSSILRQLQNAGIQKEESNLKETVRDPFSYGPTPQYHSYSGISKNGEIVPLYALSRLIKIKSKTYVVVNGEVVAPPEKAERRGPSPQ